MYAEWERHAEALQDIIARGAPELKNLQPIFEGMENVNNEVRQNLLKMVEENEKEVKDVKHAKDMWAYFMEQQKAEKDEL